MNIEELLNKYFEGETTCEEERELRRFFTRGIIPEHLQMYRPMFAFLNEENRQSKTAVPEVPKTSVPLRRRLLYIFSGMAAGILLILGISSVSYSSTSFIRRMVCCRGGSVLMICRIRLNSSFSSSKRSGVATGLAACTLSSDRLSGCFPLRISMQV